MADWPADKIKRRKVKDLIPYARNARTHSDEQVAQIAASINEWGWTTPVLIDDKGGIIAGHGRVMAARKLGIDEVPTMTATGWTKAQKAAYVLADNQLPQNAGWDMDLLSVEMKDLDAEGFDLSLMGFNDDMLANIFDSVANAKELKNESYSEIFNVIVQCEDEQQQERVFNELDEKGYKCQVQSL